jgi:hypothetical protein
VNYAARRINYCEVQDLFFNFVNRKQLDFSKTHFFNVDAFADGIEGTSA